jgi:hypothetical protein
LSGLPASAADIFSGVDGTVYVRGPIEDGDYSKFLAASGGQNLSVDLSSPGGNLFSALQIGAYVRGHGYSTLVRDESTCASACALLWLAGRNRVAGRRAAIGFHAASMNGSVASDGNAVVGAYLSQLGLSLDAVVKLTHSSPDDMYWLKLNDAKALGIDLYVKDGETVQHQPVTTYQPASRQEDQPASKRQPTLREAAFDLSARYLQALKEGRIDSLAKMYGPTVSYHGKTISNAAVRQDLMMYLETWSTRSYAVDPDSVAIFCDQKTCDIALSYDWDVSSERRNLRSVGTVTTELELYEMIDGTFLIDKISEKIRRRQLSKLREPACIGPFCF